MEESPQQNIPLPEAQNESSPSGVARNAENTTSTVIIILLLLFFQPLAWYLMWKQSKYHHWFPYLLWIYGFLVTLLFFVITLFIYPQLASLYKSLDINQKNTWLPYAAFFAITLGICEIAYGFFLYKKMKDNAVLTKKLLTLTILILFVQWITMHIWVGIIQFGIIAPTYTLTSKI